MKGHRLKQYLIFLIFEFYLKHGKPAVFDGLFVGHFEGSVDDSYLRHGLMRQFSQICVVSLDFEEKPFYCSVSSKRERLPGKYYGNYWKTVLGLWLVNGCRVLF